MAKVTMERDLYKNSSAQLKQENNQKWRLQERDDWKSLVDSIQKDRARLQDECLTLQVSLDTSHENEAKLKGEIDELRGALAQSGISSSSHNNNNDNNNSSHIDNKNDSQHSRNDTENYIQNDINLTNDGISSNSSGESSKENSKVTGSSTYMSPVKIKKITIPPKDNSNNGNGNGEDDNSSSGLQTQTITGTPHSMARRLKMELERATTLLEEERKAAETERMAQSVLISRLQNELTRYHFGGRSGKSLRGEVDNSRLDTTRGGGAANPTLTNGSQSLVVATPRQVSSSQSGSFWTFPVGNLLVSLFVGNNNSNIGSKSAIFHV